MPNRSLPLALAICAAICLQPAWASADDFEPGSLIIPMDLTHQDDGMFRAYGLVYELLRNDVPVRWAIAPGKIFSGVDFVADSVEHGTLLPIGVHGYRGGPWIIDEADAAAATPIVDAWQLTYPETNVHVAVQPFSADISKYLAAAPRVAMFADGNQKIARGYLQAAGIPDSTLDLSWSDASVDMLSVAEVEGPTTVNHQDGALFDEDGDPVYCQFMSMHWGVNDAEDNPEVVAEVRQFLNHPTHFFAECQAVNAFENLAPYGFFLTPNGYDIMGKPNNVDHHHHDSPFAQLDGGFETVGGSEPAYALPPGDSYKAGGVTMITAAGYAEGEWDVWMTGYLDGLCLPGDEGCSLNGVNYGKVSYLGGHSYKTDTPVSSNLDAQGVRLFLNSLFDSECATVSGLPTIIVDKVAPAVTLDATVTFTINYTNQGPAVALDATISDLLPPNTQFVSATNGGVFAAGTVSWQLGNLGVWESGSVSVTVTLLGLGTYLNDAELTYDVGLNTLVEPSNTTSTVYDVDSDGDGFADSIDICPNDYNPLQDLAIDPDSCGSCGLQCLVDNGSGDCTAGLCGIGLCDPGYSDCNGVYADGCEYDDSGFDTDVDNCGSCGVQCLVDNGTGDCTAGSCGISLCDPGYSDCNGVYADGCEYDDSGFDTDVDNCGSCGVQCLVDNGSGDCTAGSCGIGLCDPGHSDCNGVYADGCEYDDSGFDTDVDNCGSCGVQCLVDNGSGDCAAGSCGIGLCDPGYSDCNGVYADGCEYDDSGFDTDVDNCGSCGVQCLVDNGTGDCTAGQCGIGLCDPGWVDLDNDPANGCEYACTISAADDTTCDALDDDCDGLLDEDFAPGSCGLGVCTAASVCVAGVETCTPGDPENEGPEGDASCSDGVDNDCDGSSDGTDDDCMPPGQGGSGGGGIGGGGTGGDGTAGNGTGGDGTGGAGTGGNSSGTGGGGASSSGSSGEAGAATGGGTGEGGSGAGSSSSGSGAAGQGNAADPAADSGCGCELVGARPGAGAWWTLLLSVPWLARRRRRAERLARTPGVAA